MCSKDVPQVDLSKLTEDERREFVLGLAKILHRFAVGMSGACDSMSGMVKHMQNHPDSVGRILGTEKPRF